MNLHKERLIELNRQKYYVRMGEKFMRDLPLYRSALTYYEDLSGTGLPETKQRVLDGKIQRLHHTMDAADRAMGLLTPLERDILTGLFLEEDKTPLDICADCAIEKSTLYRHRSHALEKIGKAIYGVR